MIRNPEFRRNLLLELSPHRLLAMPVVLLIGLLFAYSAGGESNGARAVAWSALGLFGLLTIFWGTQLAIGAVVDEFRDKTWDAQRLSAQSPWTLAWGKLLGCTVFAWYGGAICLPVFLVASWIDPSGSPAGRYPMALALLMAGVALLMQALGMLVALSLPRVGQRRSSFSILLLLFLLFLGWPLTTWLRQSEILRWWGLPWQSAWFGVLSSWLFAAWAVTGVYRTLCTELQVRTVPSAWLGFAAFLIFYFAGFAFDLDSRVPTVTLMATVAFAVTLGMTYLGAWVERRDLIGVRRLLLRYRSGDRRRTLEEMPGWLATAPLALLFALFIAARGDPQWLPGINGFGLATIPLLAWLLALRDVGLLYFFSFGNSRRSPESTVMIYLLMLYWLLPALLSAAGLRAVANLLVPMPTGNSGLALLAALGQVALVGWLVVRRWQARQSQAGPGS